MHRIHGGIDDGVIADPCADRKVTAQKRRHGDESTCLECQRLVVEAGFRPNSRPRPVCRFGRGNRRARTPESEIRAEFVGYIKKYQ